MVQLNLTPRIEETTLRIEGIRQDTTILHLTDSHLMLCEESDPPELREYLTFARNWFLENCTRSDEAHPNDIFEAHIRWIRENPPDLTVFTGDMLSAPTLTGVRHLEAAFSRVGEYLFVPGNHDWLWHTDYTETGTLPEQNRKQAVSRFAGILPPEDFDFQVREKNGLLLIGMNTSDYFVTEKQLAQLRTQLDRGLPTLLFLHIPVYTEELAAPTETMWNSPILTAVPAEKLAALPEQERRMLTPPSDASYEFLSLLSRRDTPLQAVFAGHLHFSHMASLPNGVMQYVTDMGVNGTIRRIRILGK